MPQVKANLTMTPGIAVDLSFTERAKPVFMDLKKTYPRERRENDHTAMNMILNETRMDNRLEENAHRWFNNGFQGNVQYVAYFGRAPIRPGEKLIRDVQTPMFPKEDGRPLNTSQMGRSGDKVKQRDLGGGTSTAHLESLDRLKQYRRTARWHEKNDDAFHYKMSLPDPVPPNLEGMESAGLASINPSLGTCGSLPNLSDERTTLAGSAFLNKWRRCTPFAYEESRNKLWPWPNDPL